MESMYRYDWLRREMALVPRRTFFVFERRSLSDLKEAEAQYGQLPPDYTDFVREFGRANLFRSTRNPWHNLMVLAPPHITSRTLGEPGTAGEVVEMQVGFYINTGPAYFEWAGGSLLHDGAVMVGHAGQRRKAGASFGDWLKRSFAACKKIYTKVEWEQITKPAPPFTEGEQRILEAMSQFVVRKAGVTPEGNVLVEIENRSPVELPQLTIGVRGRGGVLGSIALPTAGIWPGTTKTIESSVYKGIGRFEPDEIELYRLPPPDPEDRPYFWEFRSS